MCTRDWTEHQDDGEQTCRSRGGIFEQFDTDVAGREALCCYAGSNNDGREQCGAEKLGEESAHERVFGHSVGGPVFFC